MQAQLIGAMRLGPKHRAASLKARQEHAWRDWRRKAEPLRTSPTPWYLLLLKANKLIEDGKFEELREYGDRLAKEAENRPPPEHVAHMRETRQMVSDALACVRPDDLRALNEQRIPARSVIARIRALFN